MNLNYKIVCESCEIYESYIFSDLIVDFIADWTEHIKTVDTIDFEEDRKDILKGLNKIENTVFTAHQTDQKIAVFESINTFLKSEYDSNIESLKLIIECY